MKTTFRNYEKLNHDQRRIKNLKHWQNSNMKNGVKNVTERIARKLRVISRINGLNNKKYLKKLVLQI